MSISNLSVDPLRHPSTISSLQTLTHLVETSIGPMGRLKLLENSCELTSSSQRLLHHISINNIFSKMVVSSAKSQLKTFNDGGLLCSLLILKLIYPPSLDSCKSMPLVGTLYRHFAADFLQIFKQESSLKVNFSDLKHLRSVVLTVISSKPGCVLSHLDKDHITSLLLEAFLHSIPSCKGPVKITNCFRFLVIDGLPPIESKLLKGLLIQIPKTEEYKFTEKTFGNQPIKIALFTCSLAGDTDWPVECLKSTSLESVRESTFQLLAKTISQLVLDEVNLVLCQKVAHPRMKKRLQKCGILIVDQLGNELAKCVQYISGGNSIATLACELSYGTVSGISIKHLREKNFLLLASDDIQLFSIVLFHYNKESSAELKVVCVQAVDSLLRILQHPNVCFGGGCSEIQTALFFADKVRSNLSAIHKEVGCTSSQVLESLSTFLRGITSTCASIYQEKVLDFATENCHGHLWKLSDGNFPNKGERCQCGNYDAASVDSTSWSLLTEVSNMYGIISLRKPSSTSSKKDVSSEISATGESSAKSDSATENVQSESTACFDFTLANANKSCAVFDSATKSVKPETLISSSSHLNKVNNSFAGSVPEGILSEASTFSCQTNQSSVIVNSATKSYIHNTSAPLSSHLNNSFADSVIAYFLPETSILGPVQANESSAIANSIIERVQPEAFISSSLTLSTKNESFTFPYPAADIVWFNSSPHFKLPDAFMSSKLTLNNTDESSTKPDSATKNIKAESCITFDSLSKEKTYSNTNLHITKNYATLDFASQDIQQKNYACVSSITTKTSNSLVLSSSVPKVMPPKSSCQVALEPILRRNEFIKLDELSCKLNSLSLAFETSFLLLQTTECINNLPK